MQRSLGSGRRAALALAIGFLAAATGLAACGDDDDGGGGGGGWDDGSDGDPPIDWDRFDRERRDWDRPLIGA